MTAYHWLVVALLLTSLIFRGGIKGNLKFIIVATIVLFTVYGLRDANTIGNDSSTSYQGMFYRVHEREWDDLPGFHDWLHGSETREESGWGHERNFGLRWFMKIVSEITGGEYQWVVSLIAVFVMISVAQFVAKYSPSPSQSFFYYLGLLLYTMMFNVLKQSIAMAIILYAFNAIIDRKPIKFVLIVVFASFFHFPALIFLPAYIIGNMRLGRSYLVFIAVIFILTYYFREDILNLMTDIYDTPINEESSMRFLANKVLVMVVIIIAALVIRPPEPDDKVYCTLLMLIGVSAVIQTFASYNNTFERLADYYFQLAIVFIPMVFEHKQLSRRYLTDSTLKTVQSIGPYIFCGFAIWRFLDYATNDFTLNPYLFFFQAKQPEDLLKMVFKM